MNQRENFDNKLSRLFALSRDAVLGVQAGAVVFANPAAEALLGHELAGRAVGELLPDLAKVPDAEEFVTSVTIGGRVHSVSAARVDDLLLLTIPRPETGTAASASPILRQLRECVFNLRMALDMAFPPDKTGEKEALYASILYHNQHSLLRLTGALADTAALADGTFFCRLQPMDLGQVCQDLIESVNHFTAGQTAVIEYHSTPGFFPAMIDASRIEQLLLQLLCNALLHTPAQGAVRVELQRQGKQLILRVDDTGSGIPPARLAEVFSGMQEADPADLQGRGLGLGLHIAQGIARAHGGSLIIQSREGQGTQVRLMLPAKDRLVLRDSAALDRGPSQLLTELAPVLPHRAYQKKYRD